jgi:hypothetical protein
MQAAVKFKGAIFRSSEWKPIRSKLRFAHMGRDEASLKADLNPIKRVWKSKVSDPLPARRQIDIDGKKIHDHDATESIPLSIWDFCEELRVAETGNAAKLSRAKAL